MLGFQSLVRRDFISGWQPVPASFSAHGTLAVASAILVILFSAGMMTETYRRRASIGMATFLISWLIGLHVPLIVEQPMVLVQWLGATETSFVLAGTLILARGPGHPVLGFDLRSIARTIAGLSLLHFAACHFAYAQFTADMIPFWIPGRLFWVYATGTGYVLAGLAILSGIQATPAAWATAAMMGSFTFLVHIQRIIDSGGSAPAWKLMFATIALAGSAWVIALDTKNWKEC